MAALELLRTRRCPACKQDKALSEFTVRQTGPRAGQAVAHCKTCTGAAQQVRKKRDPSIYRRIDWPSKLRRLYGLTVERYHEILKAQGGCCAICLSSSPGRRRYKTVEDMAFHVDHDHKTGRVRGLLCHLCNRALGLLRDNPDNAARIVQYLKG